MPSTATSRGCEPSRRLPRTPGTQGRHASVKRAMNNCAVHVQCIFMRSNLSMIIHQLGEDYSLMSCMICSYSSPCSYVHLRLMRRGELVSARPVRPPEAELIRRRREAAVPGLSRRQAAARADISPSQWSDVERGDKQAG